MVRSVGCELTGESGRGADDAASVTRDGIMAPVAFTIVVAIASAARPAAHRPTTAKGQRVRH